jgi:hypothetical protein
VAVAEDADLLVVNADPVVGADVGKLDVKTPISNE